MFFCLFLSLPSVSCIWTQKNFTLRGAPWILLTVSHADKQKTRRDSQRAFSAVVRLGNKAIYRTRMAMATGGELIVLAPGKNAERPQYV